MDYILDTQVFIWHAIGDSRLSRRAKQLIESDAVCWISIASIWEMAIKYKLGNLVFAKPFDELIQEQITLYDYKIYPIELRHTFLLSRLEQHHKDPFDRLIIAQSIVDAIPVVSADSAFDLYPVNRIW
ncbi:type II toxin-antitoxin system VapC family toxin [Spirosoma foliorum]|uniref:Type II toxin-antitoxin system VapC family toxin n=1 Tax=Spirosoma foliorum TaxID=2710596 RepID=A0A7G5H448_9BACT|nr:type II toxin-antitoxin system VapC family toxin [Spirosoma foliorum]QMW05890.1 type II toxin-antitoxin system VapC family toxin [Spirosoma foliorum]